MGITTLVKKICYIYSYIRQSRKNELITDPVHIVMSVITNKLGISLKS